MVWVGSGHAVQGGIGDIKSLRDTMNDVVDPPVELG
jgi:hypothetical protein